MEKPSWVSFNQDHSCFVCGTTSRFQLFRCDPFKKTIQRDLDMCITMVEMLFSREIVALVVSAKVGSVANRVLLWDYVRDCRVGEVRYDSKVCRVRLRRDILVVVLEQKVYMYKLGTSCCLDSPVMEIETVFNPSGLCAVSSHSISPILAFPGLQQGVIRIEHCLGGAEQQKKEQQKREQQNALLDLELLLPKDYVVGSERTKFITAHLSPLACLTMALDGSVVATASTKGTIIRVFSALNGTPLHELRRGVEQADIYSMAFSAQTQWLAVSSNKGTVHVFSLRAATTATTTTTHETCQASSGVRCLLEALKPIGKYLSSKSFAQMHLSKETPTLVGFGDGGKVVRILGLDGSLSSCRFDPLHGGEMQEIDYQAPAAK